MAACVGTGTNLQPVVAPAKCPAPSAQIFGARHSSSDFLLKLPGQSARRGRIANSPGAAYSRAPLRHQFAMAAFGDHLALIHHHDALQALDVVARRCAITRVVRPAIRLLRPCCTSRSFSARRARWSPRRVAAAAPLLRASRGQWRCAGADRPTASRRARRVWPLYVTLGEDADELVRRRRDRGLFPLPGR